MQDRQGPTEISAEERQSGSQRRGGDDEADCRIDRSTVCPRIAVTRNRPVGSAGPAGPGLDGIVKDRDWAIVLGKALFFDQQVGSEDGQACYSCHFVAGADTRRINQLTPGFNDVTYGPDGDGTFGSTQSDTGNVAPGYMPSGAKADSNYTLMPEDMPLHRLQDETNRNSAIVTTTNDRVSSQGAYDSTFGRVGFFRIKDRCGIPDGSIFHAGPYAARQVEPRNTPTVVNAAFNLRNFLDARANNQYNGVGVFGIRDIRGDKTKRLIVLDNKGKTQLGYLTLDNASLASQAMAPPISEREMSCEGRDFQDVGRKMLLKVPLALQKIDQYDSVFGKNGPKGDLRGVLGRGLKLQYIYAELIKKAFDEKYWKASGFYKIGADGKLQKATILNGYSQMAHNFSMFWGISIMLYESTQVATQAAFDQLVSLNGPAADKPFFAATGAGCLPSPIPGAPHPPADLDPLWLQGCNLFYQIRTPAQGAELVTSCSFCHGGPLFSEAATTAGQPFGAFLSATDVKGLPSTHDLGSINIGVRPVFSDVMTGGKDPYGNPLAYVRQYQQYLAHGNDPSYLIDPFLQKEVAAGRAPTPAVFGKQEADGTSKVPTLRNVALTPPYFSWGGYPDLRQVLKTYNRGMNWRLIDYAGDPDAHGSSCSKGDDSGTGPNGDSPWPVTNDDCDTNITGIIGRLGMLDCDQYAPGECPGSKTPATDDLAALEVFLKSLTDPRVQCDQAPFDHPSFYVFNGHKPRDLNNDRRADDVVFELPAVGAAGYNPYSGYCVPNSGDLFAPGMQSRAGGPKVPLEE